MTIRTRPGEPDIGTLDANDRVTIIDVSSGLRAETTVAELTGATGTAAGVKTFTGGIVLDDGTKTATAAAGAATLNKLSGKITTEALTTAAGGDYTLTITNSKIAAADIVMVSLANGTNTTAPVFVRLVTPAAGSVAIVARNDAAVALNGTLVISFVVWKA